jgi:hypothetical protein
MEDVMDTNERYVKSKWEHVIVCDASYRRYAKDTILLNWANHQFYELKDWSAAKAFTVERERQIAEIEEEIVFINLAIKYSNESCGVEGCGCEEPFKRILAREQAALDALKVGMKQ